MTVNDEAASEREREGGWEGEERVMSRPGQKASSVPEEGGRQRGRSVCAGEPNELPTAVGE